jgi:small conductance mechanosensitive channel
MSTIGVQEAVLRALEHVAAAVAVLVVGTVLAITARALLRRWLSRHEARLGPSFVRLIAESLYFDLLILTGGLSLIALGVPQSFVVGAIVVILIIFAVALRESVADLAATVIFLTFHPFNRGEVVETLGQLGEVRELLMFDTVLHLGDGRLAFLPNSKIREEGVVNHSRAGELRVDLDLTVAYTEDLTRVRAVLESVLAQQEGILREPDPEITTLELADVGVRMRLSPVVAGLEDYWESPSSLRESIKEAFDREGIRFATLPTIITQPDLAKATPSTHQP